MASASITSEEENYVRISLLLTGISPRAVKTLFDREFAPSCLDSSLKKEYNKLKDLQKKRIINQSQWNLLFPRYPDVPDSKTFDITLMITLLRNLTIMNPPYSGYDILPKATETTPAADLCRIKYYRNHFAHHDGGKIDTAFFKTSWTDMTEAIIRLGGQTMKQECDKLKTKPLDHTYHDIMEDIKSSKNEIQDLRRSLERLEMYCIKTKQFNELQQENHDVLTNSLDLLSEKVKTFQDDTVPWNIRASINKTLDRWKDKDTMFVNTRAAQHVLKSIKENHCVTITASFGVGKTVTLRHVAVQLAKDGFDVFPVRDPNDMFRFHNPTKKTLFVIDDLCGNFSLNHTDIKIWEPIMKLNNEILENKYTKIIVACRLQVYQDDKFDTLSMFKSCVCNLLSDNLCLMKPEKQAIAELYLKSEAPLITDYHNLYDCFPLLCKLYHNNPSVSTIDFFQHPYLVYELEIDMLQKQGYFGKYCALALCVMFNNKVQETILTEEIDNDTRTIIKNTCEACRLDTGTSRLIVKDELDSLTHTFVKKDHERYLTKVNYSLVYKRRSFYTTKSNKLFDLIAYYFGQKIVSCLIKNAHSSLIRAKFILQRQDDMGQFITVVPPMYHQLYIQRMIDDWSRGKLQDVFSNINMKIHQFRQRFLCHLKTFKTSYQKKLAHTLHIRDDNDDLGTLYFPTDLVYDTVILQCCYIGDISMIKWCFNHGVEVNHCGTDGHSPLMIACKHGHAQVVEMLLGMRADYNKNSRSESPLRIALELEHTDIAIMLLDKIAIYNKMQYCAMALCVMFNNKVMVEMLTDEKTVAKSRAIIENTCEACNLNRGTSRILIKKELDSLLRTILWKEKDMAQITENNNIIMKDKSYYTANYKIFHFLAHFFGQKIIKCLINNADSRFISQMLALERRQDMDQFTIIVPVEYHQLYIQRIIEDWSEGKVQDVFNNINMEIHQFRERFLCYLNTLDINYQRQLAHTHEVVDNTPLWSHVSCFDVVHIIYDTAILQCCSKGYIPMLQWCFNNGVDVHQCGHLELSPLTIACRYNHAELVRVLLDKGADFSKCDLMNQSPVLTSCEHGCVEVLKKLLDKGAPFTPSGYNGQSPLMTACNHGHIEIVRTLIHKGAYLNECNHNGHSPVMIACKNGHTEIVRLLLDKEVDYDKCDNEGRSLVMIACENGQTEIVRMLLDKGADYNESNIHAQLPVTIASRRGHHEIVTMIIEQSEKKKIRCKIHV